MQTTSVSSPPYTLGGHLQLVDQGGTAPWLAFVPYIMLNAVVPLPMQACSLWLP